ncbi:MAG: hypothetical protein QMD12_01450 [Candidatus Aenigmarchaeota archaeon]|nr:hypothetical protein [Candidatus Aenigmarchaeota archaeon]
MKIKMKKYSFETRQRERKIESVIKQLKKFHWKYRNLIFLTISIILAYFLLKSKHVVELILGLKNFGYISAFIVGIFFAYGLTAAPATAILYILGKDLNPFLIASLGACGAVLSDYLIFRFVRDKLIEEITRLSEEVSKPFSHFKLSEQIRFTLWEKISRTRVWNKIIPIIAGFIIASPLPDELGAALFGASKYEPRRFIFYSYLLNFVGILGISYLATI